jgi:hypothetical protein
MNEAAIIDRAVKAKAILDNPMYAQSFDMVRLSILNLIEKCPISDTESAENLRKCLKLLRDVRANLDAALNSGKIVQFDIAEAELKRKNPLRGFFK